MDQRGNREYGAAMLGAEASAPSEALRLLLSTVLDAVVAIDNEGAVVGWNSAAEETFGWRPEEALGRNLNDLIVPPEHQGAHAEGIRRVQRTGETHVLDRRIEITAVDRSQRKFPIELSITRAPDGCGAAFVGFMRDVSQRHEADAALRLAQETAENLAREREAILSQLAEAVIIADAQGALAFVNEAAAELHGVRELGVTPEDYSETYHLLREDGSPYPSSELPLARAVSGETVKEARWRIRRPDGSIALAVGTARPLLDDAGGQVGAVLTARDETERDRAETLLRDNEARLRTLTDNLPGGAVYQIRVSADASERKFIYLSQSFTQMTGIPVEAVLADSAVAYEAVHPEDRAAFLEAEAAAIREGSPFDLQARFFRANGELIWCRFISAPRPQPDGSLVWDGLQIDISSRVETENALRELNHSLEEKVAAEVAERERIWTVMQDLFVVSGIDGRYRKVNPAWRSQLGYEPEALIGTAFDALVHADDLQNAEEAFAALQRGEPIGDVDIRIRAADGSYPCYSWTCVAEADGFYAAGRDVTARKELEEQLRQSQKMEAVGQLTGGIAHDFNNLLTIIRSAVDMMRRRDLPEDRRRRYIDAVAETVERASRLTSQLLAFARRQPLRPEVIDLAVQIPIIMDLVRPLLGSRIRVEMADLAQRLFVKVDLSQFETALINLMVNARDSMSGEGRIEINAIQASTIPPLRGEPARRGDFIAVTVSDTGTGIEPDDVDRIFEPFFTTKEVGRGTGLGLSQVFGFVQQSGGNVEVRSKRGEGSQFTIFLPRSAPPSPAGEIAPGENALVESRPLRVLVVEDDERVGEFSTETLHDLGYVTTLVTNATAALAELERDDLGFDVVFSDVIMPGQTGLELAQIIRERHPGLPVLLTSGYSEVIAKEGTFGFDLLRKPYSVEALSRALRSAARR